MPRPSPRITRSEVESTAALARLSLTDRETERLAADLGAILDYAAALAEVDTSGTEPTSHVIPLPTPLREDEPAPPLDPALALANAPESSGSAFVVPRVIEGEDEG
jgi:aspartyl-tRNA(Asn)/glutamyl-tRNA(Gln) amidotransferase subunit C